MTVTEPWTCPTCNSTVSTPYCPDCGERPLRARDLTLGGLFHQLVEALTHVDGRIMASFRCLVGRPGVLTVAYLRGQRKPYIGPVPLFLIANALFFAAESLTHGMVFTTPLDSHLHTQPWSPVAEVLVSHRLAARQTTLDIYAPIFERAVAINARSLIMVMALSFVPVLSIVFHRSGRPLVAHAVLSLHLYAFLLLLFCVATAVEYWLGGAGSVPESLDEVISLTLLAACATYLYIATGAVYAASGAIRVLKVATLTVAVASIVLGYRFALLLITLYLT